MKLMTAIMAVFLTVPAFAQVPEVPKTPTMPTIPTMPAEIPNSVSGAANAAKSFTPSSCQGLIDQASSLMGTLKGGLKASALSELTQAKSSLSSGNISGCMSHANKALGMVQ